MKYFTLILFLFIISQNCKEKEMPVRAEKADGLLIQTSSSLEDRKNNYKTDHLSDKTNKSWCEGNVDIGIGEKINFKYNNPQKVLVENLYIKNGYGDIKYYSLNGRVKEFKVFVDDKDMGILTIPDLSQKQIIKFSNPLVGNKFTLEIVSTYPGKLKDTCIAELSLVDFIIPEPPISIFCGISFSEFQYSLPIDNQGTLLDNGDIKGSGSGGQQCGEFGSGSWSSSETGDQFSINIFIKGKRGETCAGGDESLSFELKTCDKENNTAVFKKNSYLDKNVDINCEFTNTNGKLSLGCSE